MDKLIKQFLFNGLVIHVAFKSRARASSKYDGGDFNNLSFLTKRHFFKYCRFLPGKVAKALRHKFESGLAGELANPARSPRQTFGHLAWET